MSTPAPPPAFDQPPTVSPATRLRVAADQRHQSDYVFTGPGLNIFLTIITCGIYGFYLFYQLMRRDRDHNRRRLDFLDAANALAWERASSAGLADELRPAFERVAANLATMRSMTTDFRDPGIWVLIAVLTGGLSYARVAEVVGYILIDQDLDRHDRAEGAAEAELAALYARLGATLPPPDPARVKGKHNYVGRVVATIVTCGLYLFWWLYDLQVEGNRHVEGNWPFEDAVLAAAAA